MLDTGVTRTADTARGLEVTGRAAREETTLNVYPKSQPKNVSQLGV